MLRGRLVVAWADTVRIIADRYALRGTVPLQIGQAFGAAFITMPLHHRQMPKNYIGHALGLAPWLVRLRSC